MELLGCEQIVAVDAHHLLHSTARTAWRVFDHGLTMFDQKEVSDWATATSPPALGPWTSRRARPSTVLTHHLYELCMKQKSSSTQATHHCCHQ